jgi:hypothetical protein
LATFSGTILILKFLALNSMQRSFGKAKKAFLWLSAAFAMGICHLRNAMMQRRHIHIIT